MASPHSTSSPISIGWSSSSSSRSHSSSFSSTSSSNSSWDLFPSAASNNLACAYPAWPSRSSLFQNQSPTDVPNAYISDFDLYPEDLDDESSVPHLDEAPAPPRMFTVQKPLMPLYASERPRNGASLVKKRRSSSKKRMYNKPTNSMPPIAETAANQEE